MQSDSTLHTNSRALIVVANPSAQSFSHAVAAAARDVLVARGFEPIYHDLYVEQFDPVQRTGELGNRTSTDELVETHVRDLTSASIIVICHPNWWGQPPAILKGWLDRVFRPGVAYDYPPGVGPEGLPIGLLRARAALIFNTSNTPADREVSVFGDPLDILWKRCIFGLSGVGSIERRMFSPMASSTPEQRALWISEARELVSKTCSNNA